MSVQDSEKASRAMRSSQWLDRVKYFMQKGASAIVGEGQATAGHTERAAYASKILDGTASIAEMAIGVLTNATIIAGVTDDGETSVYEGKQDWVALTSYGVGAVVRPSTPNARLLRCTVAGTSGAVEPTWSTTIGNTVGDATVTWTVDPGGVIDSDLEFTVNSLVNDFAGYDP